MIAFCGVWFMAETAKVLNPDANRGGAGPRGRLQPGGLLPGEQVRAFKRRHPDHVDRQLHQHLGRSEGRERHPLHVAQCRRRSSIRFPPEQPILFLPDINLGNYVKKQTGRENMKIWQGACIVHATFPARRLAASHARSIRERWWWRIPECPADVLAMADFIGSTSAIIEWCAQPATADEFIVMTESGVQHSLEKLAPDKQFYFVANENCNCSECPYMKLNTLEKLRDCLRNLEPRVELSPEHHASGRGVPSSACWR